MRPTRLAVLVFASAAPLAVVTVLIDQDLWAFGLLYAGAALAAAAMDALSALPPSRLRLDLQGPEVLFIGDTAGLAVRLSDTQWPRATRMELLLDVGPGFGPETRRPTRVLLHGQASTQIPLAPEQRGTVHLQRLWIRWLGPLGLIWRLRLHTIDRTVAVVPNIRAVRSAAIPFVARDAFIGIKIRRQLGGGSEFEALRDYMPGFDHRSIDWKHSARHCKLISKEFQAERNHNVILAFDTGHLMREPVDGIPRLDHAINAGLLLAYLALRTGDRVGTFAFDARIRQASSPISGVAGMPRLLEATSRLDYQHEETNFTLGLADLNMRLKRRSLVILFTEFVDTVTAELMVETLGRLADRHVVVFVTLRERTLTDTIGAPPLRFADMARSVVAADFVRERRVVFERIRRLGVHALDVPSGALAVDLVNRYLTVRRMELV